MLSHHPEVVEKKNTLPSVGQTEPEIFDEENYESDMELDYSIVAYDQIEPESDLKHFAQNGNGPQVKVEMMDEDETFEVIEMDDNCEDPEIEVDWETEELQYETGLFTCQWELSRFDPDNGLYGDPIAPVGSGQVCNQTFTSRAEFVDHSRQHIDK